MQTNLKEIRKQSNKTQEEVAADLGVSLSTYRTWEQGQRDLNGKKLLLLAQYFGVSCDVIVGNGFQDVTLVLTSEERELVTLYRSIDRKCQRALLVSARTMAEDDS